MVRVVGCRLRLCVLFSPHAFVEFRVIRVVPLVYHPYSPSPISSTSVCPALKVLEYLFRSTEVLTKQYWSTDEEVLKCWRRSDEVLTKEC